MNDLRLILLGIGLLFIAGIYFWDVYKTKKHIRSRVEKFSSDQDRHAQRVEITPREDLDDDDLDAFSEFQELITSSRQDENDNEPLSLSREVPEPEIEQQLQDGYEKEEGEDIVQEEEKTEEQKPVARADNKLIVVYLMAGKNKPYTGTEILKATEQVGLRYGSMDIFHFYESGNVASKKALFSLLNIVEPGLFDLKQMEKFSTHGLAMFMQVSEENDNELIFDIMIDTAWKLVEILGGELHDDQHNVIDPLIVNSLREKLYS